MHTKKSTVASSKNVKEATVIAEPPSKLIPLSQVLPDPAQPRKHWDETEMQEFTASVKQHGILQPVLLRLCETSTGAPVSKATTKGKKNTPQNPLPSYMVVCGERRYRAAIAAGLSQIPAVIRTLTDVEALEIQIVENLQRKDVLPMEEAQAFKLLHENHSFEEIAARVGKPAKYVAQRIKLTDLLPEFGDILSAGKMKLTDALVLCRLPATAQKEILQECHIPKNWQKDKSFELDRLAHYLRRQEHELDSAPFKTEDAQLYPEMGACNQCPYNSQYNKLLFPELQKKRICHNSVCYSIKATRSYQQQIEEAVQNPGVLLVTKSSYLDNSDKAKVKAAEELGAVVLGPDLFREVQLPEPPQPWEEYKEDYDAWSDEGLSEEEKAEAEQECKGDWERDMQRYQNDLKEYEDAKASGSIKKAFVVVGYREEGKVIDVILKSKKGAEVSLVEGKEHLQTVLEITRLKERETRNAELDREKVYKRLCEELKTAPFFQNGEPLTETEWHAAMLVICEKASYTNREWLQKAVGMEGARDYQLKELYNALQNSGNLGIFYQFIRRTILDALINATELDRERYGKAAAIYAIAGHYLPEQVARFEAEQQEKAEKRRVGVNKRITDLETKMATVGTQPAEAA